MDEEMLCYCAGLLPLNSAALLPLNAELCEGLLCECMRIWIQSNDLFLYNFMFFTLREERRLLHEGLFFALCNEFFSLSFDVLGLCCIEVLLGRLRALRV